MLRHFLRKLAEVHNDIRQPFYLAAPTGGANIYLGTKYDKLLSVHIASGVNHFWHKVHPLNLTSLVSRNIIKYPACDYHFFMKRTVSASGNGNKSGCLTNLYRLTWVFPVCICLQVSAMNWSINKIALNYLIVNIVITPNFWSSCSYRSTPLAIQPPSF